MFQREYSDDRGVRTPPVSSAGRSPVPGWLVPLGDERLELLEELLAARHGEGADDTDRGELPVLAVEPEQERADGVGPALVDPVAGDDAVGGALVLDLEHEALVGLVGDVDRLGDDPVEPGALELGEPAPGDVAVGGRGGQVDRGLGRGEGLLERGPALGERLVEVGLVVEREQVEGDEGCRGLGCELLDA